MKKFKVKTKGIGRLAWYIGIIGAILLGFLSGLGAFSINQTFTTILVVAGIIIGLVNITKKETMQFLLSVIGLAILSGAFLLVPSIGGLLESIVETLAKTAIPAGMVVAIASVFKTAK